MRLQAPILSVSSKNIVEGRDGRIRSLDLYSSRQSRCMVG